MNLKIKAIKVGINSRGMDIIWFELDTPTACPIMNYDPQAKMEAQAGYGVQWVRETFGIEPEIIDMRGH